MTNLLKICALGLLAFGLVACDEVSQKVNEAMDSAGNALKSANIETPLVGWEFNDDMDVQLYIQSQDDNTSIEDIIINRGNCAFVKYKLDSRKLQSYEDSYPDRVFLDGGVKLMTKGGEFVNPKKEILSSESNYYNSLDSASKALYNSTLSSNLPYSKKLIVKTKCEVKDILEVKLTLNGGASATYNMQQAQ